MPLTQEGKQRSQRANEVLALPLSGVAGAVNAIGFLEVGVYTSHMSGTATEIGEHLGASEVDAALQAGGILLWFLFGAMTATVLIERPAVRHGARYAAALLVEIFVLTGFALVAQLYEPHPEWLRAPLMGSLCFAMGLQNALVTKISGAVIRTTHLTGVITDFGIEMVKVLSWLKQHFRSLGVLRELATDPELYKARLHAAIAIAFISGGAMGTAAMVHLGHTAMLGPVIVLTALVIYDRIVSGGLLDRLIAASPFKKTG